MSRPLGMVQHVLAEIALTAVGPGGGSVALDVAVLAAGHVFGRALRIAATLTDRVVIVTAHRHRRLVARGAGGDSDGEQHGDKQARRGGEWHTRSPVGRPCLARNEEIVSPWASFPTRCHSPRPGYAKASPGLRSRGAEALA